GKANTAEASENSSGTEGWITVKRKKKYPGRDTKVFKDATDTGYYKGLARKFSRLQN
ncbi:hypothetical protein MKW98_016278, partial [Papaver atlanticum]